MTDTLKSMERSTPPTRRFLSPTVLAVVAVTMPAMAASGEPFPAAPRGETAISSQQRADLLVRAVSEAARQLCGSQVAAISELDGVDRVVPNRRERVALPTEDRPGSLCLLRLSLIDLPPPTTC